MMRIALDYQLYISYAELIQSGVFFENTYQHLRHFVEENLLHRSFD